MPEETKIRPRRRYELSVDVGGDTWQLVVDELRFLLPHIEDHGPECTSVAGSPSSNHVVVVHHNPDMTNEKYFEDLHKYLGKGPE